MVLLAWYQDEGSPEFYDKHWDSWLPRTQQQAKNPHAYKIRMANSCSGLVLDAGCGYGALSRFIKDGVFVDFSRVGLKKRWIGGGKRPRLNASVEDMPFRNAVFDSVLAADVIEHTDNPNRFIREVFRILKSPGFFTCSFPWADNSSCHKFKQITKSMVYNWVDPPFKKYKLLPANFKLQPRAIIFAYK